MGRRRVFKWALLVLVPLALVLAVPAAFSLDQASHDGKVLRNVRLEGDPIGGLDEAELRTEVEAIAERYRLVQVELRADDGEVIRLTADGVGLEVDIEATVAAALAAGRDGGFANRFRTWIDALTDDHDIEVLYRLDEEQALAKISGHPGAVRTDPVEPTYAYADGKITPVPGVDGARLEPGPIVADLLAAAEREKVPVVVEFDWVPLSPRLGATDLASGLARAENLVARPIPVTINGHATVIAPETARRWIRADENLDPFFDPDLVKPSLEAHLSHLTAGGNPPEFTVVDGAVQVTLGDPVLVCCDGEPRELADLMLGTARGVLPRPAELTPRVVDPDGPRREAEEYGIVQVVGEFTTNHRCCQNRVQNIQRIADLVRGHIIEPGGRFSVNEFVGKRTREKGFVAAGVIESGRFTDDVGGGISQFATTMFNAAFFAGLDFETYQSHSIYISRYPYGREATLSFPMPDLVVTNPTPYHMLIWTSYTDTSITVQLYSTPYFTVEQTGQDRYAVGRCTGVNTYRSRTDPAGTVIEDFVVATYRPGEGLDCRGRPTPRVP